MKSFATIVASLALSYSALAATKGYDLKMNININDQYKISPRLKIAAGEMGSITETTKDGKVFVDVIATEGGAKPKDGILMQFTVGTIDAKGKRTIASQPQLLTGEGQEAQATVTNKSTKVSVSATATRTSI